MIDPSEMELSAMQSCLAPLGEYVGSIGMHRTLGDYSRDEVLALIDVVVSAYQQRMVEEHELMATKERELLGRRMATQAAARSEGRV
jgi:hypothetical protein